MSATPAVPPPAGDEALAIENMPARSHLDCN